ncbi:hypothetical protein GCG54_00008288 [Colletotrichum gloeosporioides]|uniref:Uncharacterized protein n=1 Tax=Colletotrichum gloeosporioides TaxID=474922 RepID=A0A8H4FEE9_COLGL|nr:uncharacterized protein GCG54_00008288 [Colletotrichum gloeosporioides]KAF3798830.1 hypothetical protein GCG54_00008288 [Colletotrichum gloeosporioides]
MSSQRHVTSAATHAKYRYKPRGYFPKQAKWLNLTVSLFNADVADVLLSEAEKNFVIVDLSRAFTQSETLGNSGDIYHNRTVRVVKQMLKGDVAIVEWQVCAAILRHQLQIPEHWLENPTFRQYYDGMIYLRGCSMGDKVYSKNGIKRAMRGAEFAQSQHRNYAGVGYGDVPTGPMPRPEATHQTRAVHQNESRKRREPETSTPFTLAGGSTASEGQLSASQVPRKNKRRAERDESTATLQGHIEVIDINSDDEDVKPATKRPRKDAQPDRKENTDPDWNNTIGRVNTAEAQQDVERQIVTETSDAEVQKTTRELRNTMRFLSNIAASESEIFRRDILHSFITTIQSNGWNELVQCASELVIAEGSDYRQFLAEQLREKLTERVNNLSA